MKKTLFLLLVSSLIINSAYATIWRVNNNGGVATNFTTIQAAADSAATGDTIYVEGSATSYGNLTLSKQAYIYGPGYFLAENDSTQANPSSAMIDIIYINSGSAGSLLTGITVNTRIDIYENNITIKRNYILSYGIRIFAVSNIMILQNYISVTYANSSYEPVYVQTGSSNIFIQNNYIKRSSLTYNAIEVEGTSSAQITNNVIDGNVVIANSTMTNNILIQGSLTETSSGFFNNIADGTQFPVGNGNQQNVNMATGMFDASQTSTDGAFMLDAASPAVGAGLSAEDCGMYGGIDPYILSGLPAIPSIFFFSAPSSGSSATGLPITIKVKSNN